MTKRARWRYEIDCWIWMEQAVLWYYANGYDKSYPEPHPRRPRWWQ